MELQINWLAVILAGLSTMVVGSIWYTPKVFGDKWEKLARINPNNRASAGRAIVVTLVVSLVSAIVLAYMTCLLFAFYQHSSYFVAALATAAMGWLGFTATRFVTHDTFENRPWQLTLMNVAHELLTFVFMAVIIGLLPPGGITAQLPMQNGCTPTVINGVKAELC